MSSYMGRSARSLNQSAYSTGTAASTGRIVRSSPAPRFHPFIIIAVVIIVGVVIIGLVMTVIGNWPGFSPVGVNVLEIVGPIILGVGGLALILTVVFVVMRNKSSRDRWRDKYINAERQRMYASRTTMEPTTPTGSIGRPNKSILKKTPSTSTYGRDSNVFAEDYDSGVPRTGEISYEPESDGSEAARRQHPVYRIETMPDPHAARATTNHRAPVPSTGSHQPYIPGDQNQYPPVPTHRLNSSTESESHVPVPIRVPKAKKRATRDPSPQMEAESYATHEPPLARGSPLTGAPDLGYMGDRLSYTSDGAEPMDGSSPPPVMTSQPPARVMDQPKARRQLNSYDNTGEYDAFADPNSQPPAPTADGDTEPLRRTKKKKKKSEEPLPDEGGDGFSRDNEVRRSKPRKKKKKPAAGSEPDQADPTLTRINIAAQPGTSVHITPGFSQNPNPSLSQVPPQMRGSKGSVGSVETEI